MVRKRMKKNGDVTFYNVTNADVYKQLLSMEQKQDKLLNRVTVNEEKISTLQKFMYGTMGVVVTLALTFGFMVIN